MSMAVRRSCGHRLPLRLRPQLQLACQSEPRRRSRLIRDCVQQHGMRVALIDAQGAVASGCGDTVCARVYGNDSRRRASPSWKRAALRT